MTSERSNSMRPQDWFGVAVRTLGVWTLLRALSYSLSMFGKQNDWFADSVGTSARGYYFYCLADLAAGLFMLLGADLIVGVAYRTRRGKADDESSGQT